MDRLSEELLDYIVAHVSSLSLVSQQPSYADLLNLSVVSHQLHRIVEPYLYRDIRLNFSLKDPFRNQEKFFRTLHDRSKLGWHIRTIYAHPFPHPVMNRARWILELPRLHTLEADMGLLPLTTLEPVIKSLTIRTLRLRGVQIQSMASPYGDLAWDCKNETINTLDISLADSTALSLWGICGDLERLAGCLANVHCLRLHSIDEEDTCRLHSPAFRALVRAFERPLRTTIRDFTFRYNDGDHGDMFDGIDDFDARGVIRSSLLERLETETNCLLRTNSGAAMLRSLTIGPLCLPITLRKLYLRHAVYIERMAPQNQNLMHSEEAQCLSQLVTLLGRNTRCPGLQDITVAVFLPVWFQEIASRVIRKHARGSKVHIDFVFA
jgi:hypothetical protein